MKKLILWLITGAVIIAYPIFNKFVINHEKSEGESIIPIPSITQTTTMPTVANNSISTDTTTPSPTAQAVSSGKYKDGVYTGSAADAFYGNIQVKVTISSGRISKVDFLQYPNDRGHSIEINQYAMPILQQEAISAQSEKVDIVSGATDTSQAFIQSLSSALRQAS